MLAIKLKIVGKKHVRSFRVVVQEKKSKLQGKFVDDLGWYNPHTKNSVINMERADYWLNQGAKPTVTANGILAKARLQLQAKSSGSTAAVKPAK